MRCAVNFTCPPEFKDRLKNLQLDLSYGSGRTLSLSETIVLVVSYIVDSVRIDDLLNYISLNRS